MATLAESIRRGEAAIQQFGLQVCGLPDGVLVVETFHSDDLDLSRDYALEVRAVGTVPELALDELIDAPATLTLRWEGGERCLHGVIDYAEQTGTTADGPTYRLLLRSPLHALALRSGNRVFLGQGVVEIAREVLRTAGLPPERVRFEIADEPPPREFVVQYDETDLEFLERQLAYHGLIHTFEHGVDHATLVISDNAEALASAQGTVALDYQPLSGQTRTATTVYEWHAAAARTVRGVRVNDYNPETPRRSLEAEAGEGGDDYRFGECYGDRAEGARLARLRHEAHTWRARTVTAATDCRAVVPGARIALSGHPEPGVDGDWLIVEARLEGDQRSGFSYGDAAESPGFRARLRLIPADIAYRPWPQLARRRAPGPFTARIEGDGGDYAYLDDAGRYRIRLPFDLSDRPDAEASHPVRLTQPYGGDGYGMHFPLHHGTEVVVTCVNGDVDRPIILGALYNPDTPSPVTGSNPTQNVLRTWAGNELLMEDRRDAERIELFTSERRNRLALDACSDGHQVTLESRDGDLALHAGGQMHWEAGRDQHVEVGGEHTVTVEKDHRLLTREGDITLQSAKDLSVKAGRNVHLEATRADLTARAGRDLRVTTGAELSLEVRERDASVRVSRGSLNVQAARDLTLRGGGGGAIRIGQSGGTIEITADGRLVIDAPAVEITGGSIAINGQGIGNNS